MARKSRRPALYELIYSRMGPEASALDRSAAEGPAPPVEVSANWLSPGRRLRVPVGYLFLAGGAVIALIIVAYMTGYGAGERAVQAEFGGRISNAWESGGPVSDPLVQPTQGGTARLQARGDGEAASPDGRGGETTESRPTAPPDRSGWGPLESDPRQPGSSYFILAETRAEGARRLAEFCRANGLEAYVVPGHNARFRCVTVLPGFGSRSGPQVQRMREEIHRIGGLWKAKYPVESDLKDAYLR
ncbi:MAG: hypothetical protein JSV91_12440 [Phycisphaerales bacterium]|nr:MAG: hypothetical protein JSV91_12440 [Phycisphaerales bacterium]